MWRNHVFVRSGKDREAIVYSPVSVGYGNRVGLGNRRNRDRVDRKVIGYQSGISWVEIGKIVLIVKRSGISRDLVGQRSG